MKHSAENKDIKEKLDDRKIEIINAQTDCFTHDVLIAYELDRPAFSNDFIQGLKELNSLINATGHFELDQTIGPFIDFTLNFGTHFLSKTQYGSSVVVEQVTTDISQTLIDTEIRRNCFEKSVDNCLGVSIMFNGTDAGGVSSCFSNRLINCTNQYTSNITGTVNIDSTINIFSKGTRPLDDSAKNANAVPLKLTLTPLLELLSDRNLSNDTAYGFDESLNAAGLRKMMYENYRYGYCTKILGFTDEECMAPVVFQKGCGFSDNCDFGQYCINNARLESGFECFEVCPKGWQMYSNGRCSILIRDQKNHTEAARSCEEDYDGILAEPTTNVEQSDLLTKYPLENYWLGITKDEQSKNWLYMNSDMDVLNKWKYGEPDSEGYCAEMQMGRWQDNACDSNNSFVCVHSPEVKRSPKNMAISGNNLSER